MHAMLSFDDADKLVRAFFRAHEQAQFPGEEAPALNAKGFGGAQLAEGEIFFEYHPDARALECSALVYRFRGRGCWMASRPKRRAARPPAVASWTSSRRTVAST